MTPVEPKPAASVLLVRPSAAGAVEPLEVYMIRRNQGMKFLGGFYAFPGGKVDPGDGAAEAVARCRGLAPAEAAAIFDSAVGAPLTQTRLGSASGSHHGPTVGESPPAPAIAHWVTAVRELLEESGVLLACDEASRAIDARAPATGEAIQRVRQALMANAAPFATLLAREGWYCDLRPLRYLSHFITPRSSPIRFTAGFFLCRAPGDQAPVLFTEETSEGFWIHPGEGYRRFRAGEMAMAEPAEYGLAYLAQFGSLDEVWAAHADGRHKFHGIIHRMDEFWDAFDWNQKRWKTSR